VCQKWHTCHKWKEGYHMENKERLKPLTMEQRKFAEDNYRLIMEFLKKSKLDSEEYFDVAVFGYLLSVEIYLNDIDLQRKCKFEAVSYMYMRREMYLYFRTQKRNSAIGNNTSLDIVETNVADSSPMESITSIEYMEMIKQIQGRLTEEQWKIFSDKAKGYSLREISENHGIGGKRIYKQFGKIKQIVAEIMEI
jgi:DNA-directed RNA polymerase specialized sigma24 family protein